MPTHTVAGLVDALARHTLLTPAQVEEVRQLQASFPEPRALAGELIRRGWLTPYQINQLFRGRGAAEGQLVYVVERSSGVVELLTPREFRYRLDLTRPAAP